MEANNGEDKNQEQLTSINRLIHEPSRLTIMAHLNAVEDADFLFLVRQTGLTWGNLSVHISKLEDAGYLHVKKEFLGKKPHTVVRLTKQGRRAFEEYCRGMKEVLDRVDNEERIVLQ